jgi:hypothetical protein
MEAGMKSVLTAAMVLAGAAGAMVADPARAALININDFIVNPSFEDNGGSTTGWNVANAPNEKAGVYQPGSDQYTVGANALSPGSPAGNNGLVPNGANALLIPDFSGNGSGIISQVLDLTYQAGNTYQWTFWVGIPNNVQADNATGASSDPDGNHIAGINLITAEFLAAAGINGNPVQAGLTGNVTSLLAGAILGEWQQYVFEFTPNAAFGQNVAIRFRVDTDSIQQPHQVDFDMAFAPNNAGGGSEVPLPGAVWLMGSILAGGAGAGALRRRRRGRAAR